jgi:hypothetical protein
MKKSYLTLALFIFVIVPALQAQECSEKDTPLTCWAKFNPDVAAAAETAAGEKIAKTNTGTPSAATDSAATALRDFLSIFAAGVETGKVTENGNTVTLDWNTRFPFLNDDRLKVQTLFTDSAVAADVQKALGSDAAAVSKAKGNLTNFDDVTALLAWTPINERLGRSLAPHVTLIDALAHAVEPGDESLRAEAAFGDLLKGVKDDQGKLVNKTTVFSTIPGDKRALIIVAVEKAAKLEHENAAMSAEMIKAVTQLINNQPQAYLSGTYHARNKLVGPNEFSAKATYEMGARNMNHFRAQEKKLNRCRPEKMADEIADPEAKESVQCLADLKAYAGVKDAAAEPDSGQRLSVSFEYKQSSSQTIDLSEFSVTTPLPRPGAHSLVYSVTYGYPFMMASMGREGRLDGKINYENISGDPDKRDRFVGSITYTQKMTDTMTFPITLSYANHSRFLPETDKKFGMHFGISYKLPGSGK